MAAKKKKKKASKTSGSKRRLANPLTCKFDVKPVMTVESGTVYLVKCRGGSKTTIDVGHVTATSAGGARKKASGFLKRLF